MGGRRGAGREAVGKQGEDGGVGRYVYAWGQKKCSFGVFLGGGGLWG